MHDSQSITYFNLVCTFSTVSILCFLMGNYKKMFENENNSNFKKIITFQFNHLKKYRQVGIAFLYSRCWLDYNNGNVKFEFNDILLCIKNDAEPPSG